VAVERRRNRSQKPEVLLTKRLSAPAYADDSVLINLFDRLNDEGRRSMIAALCAGSVLDLRFLHLLDDSSLAQRAAASQAGLRALDVQQRRKRDPADA